MKRLHIFAILFLIMTGAFLPVFTSEAKEPWVIVIDPGHGGKNLGGEYGEYTEKDMTMVVARAMKEELEKYEGVEVYLTRETDEDLILEQRASFAAEKKADFLFCLHFNMSSEHDLFGAEVWIPAGGKYYSKGYSFAELEMNELTSLGLFSRGIKTKLNSRGDNYYGILRHCSNMQIPSALIEHCHLDNPRDQQFYQKGTKQLKDLGRRDATAAAKYFHLRSETLGVDYSDYPVEKTPIPKEMKAQDTTPPDECLIEVTQINEQTGEVTVRMKASDADSYILYYNYSIDGGTVFTMPDAWPAGASFNQSAPEHTFTIRVPFNREITLIAGVGNGYDLWSRSSEVVLAPIPSPD